MVLLQVLYIKKARVCEILNVAVETCSCLTKMDACDVG
jgi:hypothetical protein